MSVLSSLAGAPLVKGKRQKNMTTRISGQRADVPKAEASKAGQDFGLEEISVKSRRSPAGFGFDLTALLDDSSATDQQMQSRLQNSASRPGAEPRSKSQVQPMKEAKPSSQDFWKPGNEPSSILLSECPQAADLENSQSGSGSVQTNQASGHADSHPNKKLPVVDEGADLLDIIGAASTQSIGLGRAASAGRRAGAQPAVQSQPTPAAITSAVQLSSNSTPAPMSYPSGRESTANAGNAAAVLPESHSVLSDSSMFVQPGISGTSVNVNAIARSQHLPEVYVPALPSGHGGGAPNATPLLTTAGPQPLHSHTSLLKDAEAKLSQTCAELDATKSQLQASMVQAVQQQLMQQASLHSAELSESKSEVQQAESALAAAQAHTCQLQAELESMQKQMAVVSINKQDMQQASHLQAQLQKALQDQQALSSHLREEWQNQEQKLSIREGKLDQREQAAQGMQAEALALKGELQKLAEAMQSQADRQVTDAAEEKQALVRHQARLDTLQALMADELGQVRMQLQLEKEALERARTQRAADRDSWYQQVTSEQKLLAEDTASCHRSLEGARAAELAARKAALDFEARAKLASKEADDLEAKVRDLRNRAASEQDEHAAMQKAVAADREDISKQGAALLDMAKQIQTKSESVAAASQMVDAQQADVAKQQAKLAQQTSSLQRQSREVEQQLSAVQEAEAQLWAQRSQLAVEQQAVAEDKARAVQNAQEAAMAHSSLLVHLKQARAHSVLVEGSAGSEEEEEVRDSPRRILAAFQTKQSPVVSWSARQRSRHASVSPQSNRARARAKTDKLSAHEPAFRLMRSPLPGYSSPQAGYGVMHAKHAPYSEVSKHTHGADLGAVYPPQKPSSFIKTVPMQHVQSNYAEPLLGQGPAEQPTGSTQPHSLLPDKAWLTQLTVPAFIPLINLSPESSCSSVGQPEVLPAITCQLTAESVL